MSYSIRSVKCTAVLTAAIVLFINASCSKSSRTSDNGSAGQVSSSTPEMQKLSGGPNWNIESVNSTPDAWKLKSFVIPIQGRFVVVGWAIDSLNKAAAGGVEVNVDGTSYPAQYGTPRPDVAASLGNPEYTSSGYKLDIAANQFSPGSHNMFIRVITNDHKGYWEMGPFTVAFK